MGTCSVADRFSGPGTLSARNYDFSCVIGKGGFGKVSP